MAAGLQHISVSKVPFCADVGVDVEVNVEVVLLDELDKANKAVSVGKVVLPLYESPMLQNGCRTRIRYGPIWRYAPIRVSRSIEKI